MPDHTAVNFGVQSLTFADLDQRSNRAALALRKSGAGRQTRIAILAKNTPTFYDLLLGAAKIEAVLVPINYRLAPAEIGFIIDDSRSEILFVAPEFSDAIAEIREDLPSLREVVLIDGASSPGTDYAVWRDHDSIEDVGNDPDPGAVVVQMYTSGTTGRPKGTLLTHANLRGALRGAIPAWGPWHDRDVILVCMPQYHIGASMWGIAGLWQGVESVLTREFNASEALRNIEDYHITKTQLASVMMKMMIEDPACATTDFSSLELIVYGAAPASLQLVRTAQRVFGCGIAQGYGMTETAGAISHLSTEDHRHPVGDRLKSAGKALDGVEMRICGPTGTVLPPKVIGEVMCRGEQVTQGYWQLPEASAQAPQDGWFHTGDAGYLDEDGYLFICDRIKDVIISGGENIYPAEVEDALYAHPNVADVAVIGVPDDHWGEAAKAIVVVRPDTSLGEEELISFARARIARFKAPRSVDFVQVLPRNTSGKILKRELREPYWEGRDSKVI